MKSKFISATLLATTLMFSACGDSGDAQSALDTQQMLDNGEFSAVISKLEGSASTDSDYITLASAYMGKAGFSLSSIVGNVIASGDSNESFATYIKTSKTKSNDKSLTDLDTALSYFDHIVGDKCLDKSIEKNSATSDLCLYIGLSKVSQTAVTIGYMTDDINALTDSNSSDDKLSASICAMQYAQHQNDNTIVINSECNVTSSVDVNFTQNQKTYKELNITITGNNTQVFQNLITKTSPVSSVVVNGICTNTDFTTRIADINATGFNPSLRYYPCPANERSDTNDTTTADVLVQVLNEGTDSIGGAVSEDVKKDIDQFRLDVRRSKDENASATDTNQTVTIADITAYLAKQN